MSYKINISSIVILIIWAFLFSLACETPTEPPIVNVMLSGKIFEKNSLTGSIPIPDAIVTIDGQIDTTSKAGEFQFSVPHGKSLLLQISHPSYLPFEQRIILYGDTSMVFRPMLRLYDFFPLTIGNYWNYDYYSFYQDPGGTENIRRKGTQSWQIIRKSQNGGYTNFLVATVTNAIQYRGYNFWTTQPRHDTTLVQNDSSYFVIAADPSHILNIKYLRIDILNIKPFPRFQSLVHGDTTTYYPDGTCKFVRDIGIVYLAQGFSNDRIKLQLMDYKINPEVMDSRRQSWRIHPKQPITLKIHQ